MLTVGLILGLLAFEMVYRLVALPPDSVPEPETTAHQAAVPERPVAAEGGERTPAAATETVRETAGDTAAGLRLAGWIKPPSNRSLDLVAPALAPGPRSPAAMPAARQLSSARATASAVVPAGEETAAVEPVLAAMPTVRALPPARQRGGTPLISIIIDDMGYSPGSLVRLATMPGPLTLAFLPNAEGTPSMLERVRPTAFELMLHLPMEPLGDADPGPEALLVSLDEAEIRRRVRAAMRAVPGASGVNNHMGSRFTADASRLAVVMDELRRHGVFFVDSLTNPASLAESQANAFGLPATRRDIFIDHVAEPAAIARQLRLIELVARRDGSALAIGHPYPETLAALERWLPTLERRGFRLVRASELVAQRRCGDPALSPHDCRPPIHLVGSTPMPLRPRQGGAAP